MTTRRNTSHHAPDDSGIFPRATDLGPAPRPLTPEMEGRVTRLMDLFDEDYSSVDTFAVSPHFFLGALPGLMGVVLVVAAMVERVLAPWGFALMLWGAFAVLLYRAKLFSGVHKYQEVLGEGEVFEVEVTGIAELPGLVRIFRYRTLEPDEDGVLRYRREAVPRTRIDFNLQGAARSLITHQPEIIAHFSRNKHVKVLWHKRHPDIVIPVSD